MRMGDIGTGNANPDLSLPSLKRLKQKTFSIDTTFYMVHNQERILKNTFSNSAWHVEGKHGVRISRIILSS